MTRNFGEATCSCLDSHSSSDVSLLEASTPVHTLGTVASENSWNRLRKACPADNPFWLGENPGHPSDSGARRWAGGSLLQGLEAGLTPHCRRRHACWSPSLRELAVLLVLSPLCCHREGLPPPQCKVGRYPPWWQCEGSTGYPQAVALFPPCGRVRSGAASLPPNLSLLLSPWVATRVAACVEWLLKPTPVRNCEFSCAWIQPCTRLPLCGISLWAWAWGGFWFELLSKWLLLVLASVRAEWTLRATDATRPNSSLRKLTKLSWLSRPLRLGG